MLFTVFISDFNIKVLECLGHLLSQADILECAKPTEISNDFTDVNKDSNGQWQLYNSRFRTRVRDSRQVRPSLPQFRSIYDTAVKAFNSFNHLGRSRIQGITKKVPWEANQYQCLRSFSRKSDWC